MKALNLRGGIIPQERHKYRDVGSKKQILVKLFNKGITVKGE
jgi:hypothetical protein